MSSTSKAWIVAASVGAVEALKDQGFCRWNYTIRSMHHHAKAKLARSFSPASSLSSSSPASSSSRSVRGEKANKQSEEESLRKLMYLTCWELVAALLLVRSFSWLRSGISQAGTL